MILLCRVDKRFKDKLYKNIDPIEAIEVYKGILKNYNLLHTTGSIAVFKHKRRNQDIIVWNVLKEYKNGHGHFHNFQVAKIIANNISLIRKPKSNMCVRNLRSYLRIADDNYKYLEWVENLIDVKIDKMLGNNKNYHNDSKAV